MINLDEIEKLQIAIDIADAVYFLHNLTPVSINHSAILDVKFYLVLVFFARSREILVNKSYYRADKNWAPMY